MTPASNMRKVKGLMDNISLPTLGFYTFAAFMIVYGVHAAQGNPHVGRNAVEAMVCVHVGVSGYMCARVMGECLCECIQKSGRRNQLLGELSGAVSVFAVGCDDGARHAS